MINVLVMVLLLLTSVFLILLVLIQRGRGGGLAGAFGGMGGQSAFGTKAGDLFTRITIGVAAFWIILCAASVKLLNEGSRSISSNLSGTGRAPIPGGNGCRQGSNDSKPARREIAGGAKSTPASSSNTPSGPPPGPPQSQQSHARKSQVDTASAY